MVEKSLQTTKKLNKVIVNFSRKLYIIKIHKNWEKLKHVLRVLEKCIYSYLYA